jgi:hypothetical protein
MEDLAPRSSRDTRLLALVIIIAIVVLFVLAQFRFPLADARTTAVTTGPLDRLAARGTFDDLAAAVLSSLRAAEPALVTLSLEVQEGEPSARALGVRVTPGFAVARLAAGRRVALPAGDTITVRGIDEARELVALGMPPGDSQRFPAAVYDFAGFTYVSVVEPAAGGPTASPAFIGRVESIVDDQWGGAVLVPGGGATLPVGSFVFLLDGRLVGLVATRGETGRIIVPLARLEAALLQLTLSPPEGTP